jgi:hypothetical protein
MWRKLGEDVRPQKVMHINIIPTLITTIVMTIHIPSKLDRDHSS